MSRSSSCLFVVLLAGCSTGTEESVEVSPSADAPKTSPAVAESAAEVPVPFVAPELSAEEIRDGWISLFDGASLFGWEANSNANWSVKDGVIMADSGDQGLLLTGFQIADYEFRCDFRCEEGGNSGVFLRTPRDPGDVAVTCYELNICDSHKAFKTGSLVKRAQPDREVATDGAWNTFFVRVEGSRVDVSLNDSPLLTYDDPADPPLARGHIGLQKNSGRIEFRNVFLKPLSSESLFDGKTLDGWNVIDGSQSEFSVVDGAIHVGNGPGFLQTDGEFADFVLQTEVQVNGDGLNSGIFFRSMRGTADAPSNGYEYQIENRMQGDDSSKPADCGTGGIFRRTNARRIVASDREWFTATLIADGPRLMSWVNGYQVVDWTDTRKPDENPRRGLRLEAGHLILQGHDPTTDLDFRSIRISELK